jgi:hypothetical protein
MCGLDDAHNRQTEIMMRIASEFGFTPASRSRITAPAGRSRRFLMNQGKQRGGGPLSIFTRHLRVASNGRGCGGPECESV